MYEYNDYNTHNKMNRSESSLFTGAVEPSPDMLDCPSAEYPSDIYHSLGSLQTTSPSPTSTIYELACDSSDLSNPVYPHQNQDSVIAPCAMGRMSRRDHYLNRSRPMEVLRQVETPEVRVSKYVSVATRDDGILLYTKNATEDEISIKDTNVECPSLMVLPPPEVLPLTQTHTRKKTASKPRRKKSRRVSYEHPLEFESEAGRNVTESTAGYEKKVSVYRNEHYYPSSSDQDKLELLTPDQRSYDEFESGCNTPPCTRSRFPSAGTSNEERTGFQDACYDSEEANAISASTRNAADLLQDLSQTSGFMVLPEMTNSMTSVTSEGSFQYGDPMRKFASTDVYGDMMVEESLHKFNPPLRLPRESSSGLTSDISEGQKTVHNFPAEARYNKNKRNNWVGKPKGNKNTTKREASSYDGMITASVAPVIWDRITSSAINCSTSPRTKYPSLFKNQKRNVPFRKIRSSRLYKFEHPCKSMSSSIRVHRRQYANDLYAHYNTSIPNHIFGDNFSQKLQAQGDVHNNKLRYTLEWLNDTNNISHQDKHHPLNLTSSTEVTKCPFPLLNFRRKKSTKVRKNNGAKIRKIKNGRAEDGKPTERRSERDDTSSSLSLHELLKRCIEHTDKLDSIINMLDIGSDSTDYYTEPQDQNYSGIYNYNNYKVKSKRSHKRTKPETRDVQTQTVAIPYINAHTHCRCMQHSYYKTQTESSDTTIKWVDEQMARVEERCKTAFEKSTVQNAPVNSPNNFGADGYDTPENPSVTKHSLAYNLWKLKYDIDKLKEEAKNILMYTTNLSNEIRPGSGAQCANLAADSKIPDHCPFYQEKRHEDSCELAESPNVNISMSDIDEEILKLIDASSESDDYDEYQREIKIKVHRRLKMVEQSITEAREMKHHGCRYKKSMTIASKQMEPDKHLQLESQNVSKNEFARMARTELELNRRMYELKLRQNEETINQHIQMANMLYEQFDKSKKFLTGNESLNQI